MTTRETAAHVERLLIGLAWADHSDGDPSDPLELSPHLRLPGARDWSEIADLLLPQDGNPGPLLAEIRRLENAAVGPPGGILRAMGGPSEAWRQLAGEVARRRGEPMLRLAASTPDAAGRYRSDPIPVDGVPNCTVEVSLEPTTDSVWMGIATRSTDAPAVDLVLAPKGGTPKTVRLPESQRSVVFYLDQDPGSAPRVWATGVP